jgi:O-antigen ligase
MYILFNKQWRESTFSFRGKGFFFLFIAYTVVVAFYFKNFLGVAVSLGFFLVITVSYYARSVMTQRVFERCLDICCYAAIPLGVAAAVEKILNAQVSDYSCKLWFFNENYFCAVMAAVVIICAFNATSHKGPVLKYYICAVFGGIAMYFGESMFALVELFVGLCILLILKKKHLLLAMFLAAVVVCIIVLYAVPDIFPRLSEANITTERRIRIWNEAMVFIKENPLFGRGFLSYYYYAGQNPDMYQTAHTHNFAMEFLLCFGVVGTTLLVLFLWSYYRKVAECKELLRENCATTLILALSAAIIIHMTTDMTVMWIQTGLLYGLILGGVGIDERTLNRRISACAGLGGRSDKNKYTTNQPDEKE